MGTVAFGFGVGFVIAIVSMCCCVLWVKRPRRYVYTKSNPYLPTLDKETAYEMESPDRLMHEFQLAQQFTAFTSPYPPMPNGGHGAVPFSPMMGFGMAQHGLNANMNNQQPLMPQATARMFTPEMNMPRSGR